MNFPPRNHRFFLILLLSWMLLTSGCSIKGSQDREALSPALQTQVWQTIHAAQDQAVNLRATAKITVQSNRGRFVQKGAILLKDSASLRVEFVPPIGLPNLFLSILDGIIRVYLPLEGQLYEGRATRENMAHFLALRIPVEELTTSLLGLTTPVKEGEEKRRWYVDGKYHRLDIYAGNVRSRSLWVDPSLGYLARSEVFSRGEPVYSAVFKDYRMIGERAIPQVIEIDQAGEEAVSVRVEYLAVQLAGGIDQSELEINAPAGVKIVQLD